MSAFPISDTPETDAALVDHMPKDATEWSEHYLELSIHARKLERERDALAAALDAIHRVNEGNPVLTYQKMEHIANETLKTILPPKNIPSTGGEHKPTP